MTQDYKTKAKEALEKLKYAHSYEAYAVVKKAIDEDNDDLCKSLTSKRFGVALDVNAYAFASTTEEAYEWLKANKVNNLIPAICAGARYATAITHWFICKDAKILSEKIDCELRGVEYVEDKDSWGCPLYFSERGSK